MAIGEVGVRFDPAKSYNFLITFVDSSSSMASSGVSIDSVSVDSVVAGGFSEASGLEMTLEVEDYKEGGKNDGSRKFPTRVTWGNLRFKRGIAFSNDLWNWHWGFVQGQGKRRDGVITLNDDLHQPVRVWTFRRGLPVKWTGPALHAAQGEVAVEELEIAHEGLELVAAQTLLGLSDVVSLAQDIFGS